MRTSTVLVLLLVTASTVPAGTSQEPFTVQVKDATGADPPTNATLVFSDDQGDDHRFETDLDGEAEIDLPPGNYRVSVFVPNETGELWFDMNVDLAADEPSIELLRNLPSLGRRPEITGAEAAPDGSAVYVPIGTTLDLHIAIRYAGDAGEKTLAARATLTKGTATLQDGLIGIGKFSGAGWINGTLAAAGDPPYFATEALTTLHIRILENGTTTTYDVGDPVTVFFRDGCIGDAVQIRVTVASTQTPLCDAADQGAAWQAWATEANTLSALQSMWRQRFQGNASTWSFAAMNANWTAYNNEAAALRTTVIGRLDKAQTDTSPFPTWQQLETLRGLADANHTTIEEAWSNSARGEFAARATAAHVARLQTLGLITLGIALGAGVAFGGTTLVLRSWKRRAEYWMGYSSQDPGTSPLWFTLAISAGLFVLGLAATFLSPLWSILRGGA